jgi:CarD family transcriptional regulator
MFKAGDMAVYPAHGVGMIEAVEKRAIGEREQTFYVMRIVDSNMVIMIPTTNSDSVGLRGIVSAGEADKVYLILRQREVDIESQPWNQRYREYMEKIKTGSVFEIAAVLRDLYMLRVEKTLSFGERKMMDTARGLLIKELAIAHSMEEEQVAREIEQIFAELQITPDAS